MPLVKNKTVLVFDYTVFLFLSLLFCQNIFASSSNVFVSEVQRMGTTNSSADEWIELKNSTDSDIDLSGWVLKTEDLSVNVSLNGVIKSGGYFLLERTDDNSAYQVEGDLIYSGSLGNGGEKLILINGSGEIVDQVDKKDNGTWQSGNSSTRRSMLKDENGNWIDGEIDGNPQSGKSNSENNTQNENGNQNNGENLENNSNSQNGQGGQNGQNLESENENSQIENNTEDFSNSANSESLFFKNFIFEFQRPSYILEEFDLGNDFYTCDSEKDECKINFNFEEIITAENFSGEDFSKSDFYCQLKFGSLSTGEENKCNPNTVIFPIGETEISVKIFQENNSGEDFLVLDKKILIKNFEKNSDESEEISNSIISSSSFDKKDLSIKQGISKEKFRIKKISLNESDGDFVEIFCENCDSKKSIGGYKLYSSKNFFYFPTKKFGKYDFSDKKSVKVFLKKDCKNFENKNKNEDFNLDNNDKNNTNIKIDNLDKTDTIKNKFKNQNFCTSLKTGLVSTNGSLFLMNSVGEILDSVCWQNGKEIKGKTLDEINILKNNDLWKGECLNTDSLKKGDIFEREIFSGYNQSSSWKKINIDDLGDEKILENGESFGNLSGSFLSNGENFSGTGGDILKIGTGLILNNFEKCSVGEICSGVVNQKNVENFGEVRNLENDSENILKKSELEKKLEKIREKKKIFNKKTKFHKIYLPKDKSRIFRLKGRTLPFIRIKFFSESGEFFETVSDGKGYFKIFFDKLKKGKKFFNVEFFENGEKNFQKDLEFFLENDWVSAEFKKKNLEIKKEMDKVKSLEKSSFEELNSDEINSKIDDKNSDKKSDGSLEEENFSNPLFKKILLRKNVLDKNLENLQKEQELQGIQNGQGSQSSQKSRQKGQGDFMENNTLKSSFKTPLNPIKKIGDELKNFKNFIKNFFNF